MVIFHCYFISKMPNYAFNKALIQYMIYHFIVDRDNFILQSECGKFTVKKDELLVGNVHMVHRDESIFDQPNTFMPARFENEVRFSMVIVTSQGLPVTSVTPDEYVNSTFLSRLAKRRKKFINLRLLFKH